MTLIELLVFVALSLLLMTAGRILAKFLGTAGWLIGVVPVGVFWAWVVFSNLLMVLKSALGFLRRAIHRDGSH